jgi:hypothetical protein
MVLPLPGIASRLGGEADLDERSLAQIDAEPHEVADDYPKQDSVISLRVLNAERCT